MSKTVKILETFKYYERQCLSSYAQIQKYRKKKKFNRMDLIE